MEADRLNHDELELESALRSLSPAAARIDPISAAFTAGRRLGRRQIRIWQSAALILLVGAASWIMTIGHRPGIQVRERFEATTAPRADEELSQAPAAESLLALQEIAKDKGLDALPSANLPAVQAINVGNLF
jgi:hypothetical protein